MSRAITVNALLDEISLERWDRKDVRVQAKTADGKRVFNVTSIKIDDDSLILVIDAREEENPTPTGV